MKRAAWFAVHILASDVAVSGLPPKYLSVDLNLPPETSEDVLGKIWGAVDSECRKLGISIVTGHTARYAGCTYPMVGGATMFAVGPREKLIVPRARPGDLVIVSKGPAIETTGLMSVQFPEFLESAHGSGLVKEAQSVFYQMSVVSDAMIAANAGGVTAMHDATEGGVYGGLWEIASHSGVGMRIFRDRIVVQDAVKKTCECFGIDPYVSISEGTLLATARPGSAEKVVEALRRNGIRASVAGKVTDRDDGVRLVEGSSERELTHPETDPFWPKFEEYLEKQKARDK